VLIVLTGHLAETFEVKTDDQTVQLRLEKRRKRFVRGASSTRYRFLLLSCEPLPEDSDDAGLGQAIENPGSEK
jgi:hypothetical protein